METKTRLCVRLYKSTTTLNYSRDQVTTRNTPTNNIHIYKYIKTKEKELLNNITLKLF